MAKRRRVLAVVGGVQVKSKQVAEAIRERDRVARSAMAMNERLSSAIQPGIQAMEERDHLRAELERIRESRWVRLGRWLGLMPREIAFETQLTEALEQFDAARRGWKAELPPEPLSEPESASAELEAASG